VLTTAVLALSLETTSIDVMETFPLPAPPGFGGKGVKVLPASTDL